MAGVGGIGRMKRQSEGFGGVRRQHGRPVADGRDAIALQAAERFDGFRDAVELHCDGVVAPGIVQMAAAVAGERELRPRAPGGVGEDANLVAGGRGEKQ